VSRGSGNDQKRVPFGAEAPVAEVVMTTANPAARAGFPFFYLVLARHG
jgi:hypothetical protein